MPNILNVAPEDIDTKEKRSKYVVSVVGCGQKGIIYAIAFAQAGFKVTCLDANQSVTKKLAKGKTSFAEPSFENKIKSFITAGQMTVTSDLKKTISRSDIIILTVSTRLDDKKKVDFSDALNALKQVGAVLHTGVLVIYGEVAGLGFIEGIMKETLENTSGLKTGLDFGLAYVPINNSEIKLAEEIANLELKIAVVGKTNQDATLNFIKTITKEVILLKDVKTAEIATLFAAAKQDANAAMASELAIFCESAKADYFEMLKLPEFNDKSFFPSMMDNGNRNEAYLLLESAENLNAKLRLPILARQINEEMVKHAVYLTQDALRSCDKTLRRARIAVLGTANPIANTANFVKLLQLKGAKVSFYDSASKSDTSDIGVAKASLNEAIEGTDGIVVLIAEERFKHLNLRKLKALTKTPSVIVDLAGAFERQKVEAEGFIYRGLGRGTG